MRIVFFQQPVSPVHLLKRCHGLYHTPLLACLQISLDATATRTHHQR
nr:MAG TPA: hypothetical protein [Caudoviricetes sp.]